ncbi:MAG: metal ABC transporter permease [Erysipelotrichaceae bacterium]|nr:metal ABC transporter permease [Erysipelotrichaceae bacterium]MBQ1315320.1 metal ABC transporter permease [Erysipelotrichaceae bacterium]
MIRELMVYLSYPFVRYAFIAGILIALCSSLLGVILVLKRYSYIGDGLSHVAFGAMSVALVLDLVKEKMFIILPVTIITAVLLLRHGQKARINGDARIAMLSVGSLALGYLLMNVFKVSSNVSADVCTTLFGSTSILTLTKGEVWLCSILSLLVVVLFVLMYSRIFAVTFDETFAQATGTRTDIYNLVLAIVIAVIIVLSMNLVGSLLISALVIFPAVTAMQLFKSFRNVTIASALISVVCACCGLMVAVFRGTPVGSTIVVADLVVFVIFYIIGIVRSR